jgi:surface antigen
MTIPAIDLKVEGDGAWEDLRKSGVIWCGTRIGVAALEGGMRSGRPSIAVRLELPDGKIAVAETSLRALETAVAALVARYGSQIPEEDER